MKNKKLIKRIILTVAIIIAICFALVFSINAYVKSSTNNQIIEDSDYSQVEDIDCILILGAGVWQNKPSPMLEDRLLAGIELYKKGVSKKIIMSGEHRKDDYDEVNVMKNYAISKGVPSSDIFMDHEGFNTFESIYRAKNLFNVKRVVIVTQKYHLYRSLYIANQLGIEAYGVGADPRMYAGQIFRDIREVLARNKDFVQCIFRSPYFDYSITISLSGDGDVTNERIDYSKILIPMGT